MNKRVTSNYIYNLIYQLLILIVPLAVTPYIARILGPELIGAYSFSQSIVSYFILFGTLGINMYAQRQIAYIQNDKEKQTYVFWEIIILRTMTIGISLFLYFIFAKMYKTYELLFFIQSIDLLAAAIDITWFFQGLEEFKKVIFRNIIIKILNISAIFFFVKNNSDLPIYIFVMSASLLFGYLTLWLHLHKYLVKITIRKLRPSIHFKETIQLFIPQIAIQVYVVLDKTMIGIITNSNFENGYYEQSQKIVKVGLAILTSWGMVMAPRMAALFAKKEIDVIKANILKSIKFVCIVGIAMVFGLIGVSDLLIPWFLGAGYENVSLLTKVGSLIIILVGFSNIAGTQVLLPLREQKKVTYSVCAGAIVNVIMNCILIKKYGAMGASISSVMAETIVMILQVYFIRTLICFQLVIPIIIKCSLSGFIMLIWIINNAKQRTATFADLFYLVFVGSCIYFICLFILDMPQRFKKGIKNN